MDEGGIRAEIGIIGGSGLYTLPGLDGARRLHVPTPFGDPSSAVVTGMLQGRRVAFIARHDEGHRLLPGELPSQANIYALKRLGVECVIAVSAVGSLQKQYQPLHVVIPDQLIDRTRGRPATFFGDGIVAHVGMADPFCAEVGARLAAAGSAAGVTVHRGGTLVVIEGSAFSTRAESELYRSWGAAIIGMTALPEATLAREAELCYTPLCFVTDYDVWRAQSEDVSADLVATTLAQNVQHAHAVLSATVRDLPPARDCICGHALDGAILTPAEHVPPGTRRRLAPLLDRVWGPPA